MLVPSDVPQAAVMLSRHTTSRSQRVAQELLARLQRRALLAMLPVARMPLPRPESSTADVHEPGDIGSLVRRHVPGATRVGVLLGPPRANAKPVVQVFDADGRTVAFGKVGSTAVSAPLVAREVQVLGELAGAGLRTVEVPRLLWHGIWQGMPVLLMTALNSSQQRASSWDPPLEAMAEVATAGPTWTETLRGGCYVRDLRARLAALPSPASAWLGESLAAAEARRGDVSLHLGRWHGDWAPWNMARDDGMLQVWDWERSSGCAPIGYDLVHFVLQHLLQQGAGPEDSVRRLVAELRVACRTWYRDDVQIFTVVWLYLLDISIRYLSDAGEEPTPALRKRLTVMEAMIAVVADKEE